MTKRATIIAAVVLAAALAVFACPVSVTCPIHNNSSYFTHTEVIDGVLVGVYHCYRGHDFIARCN